MKNPQDKNNNVRKNVILLPFTCEKCYCEVMTWTHIENCKGKYKIDYV